MEEQLEGSGEGDGVIEVARKREARLVEGKGSEEEVDRPVRRKGGELQRQREKLMSRVCQPLTSIIYVQAGDARGRGRGAWCARHTVRTPLYASRVSDILIPPSCIPTASPTISSRRRHHRHRRHARATSSFAIFIRVTRRVNPRAASIFVPLSPQFTLSSLVRFTLLSAPSYGSSPFYVVMRYLSLLSRRDTANHVTLPRI